MDICQIDFVLVFYSELFKDLNELCHKNMSLFSYKPEISKPCTYHVTFLGFP